MTIQAWGPGQPGSTGIASQGTTGGGGGGYATATVEVNSTVPFEVVVALGTTNLFGDTATTVSLPTGSTFSMIADRSPIQATPGTGTIVPGTPVSILYQFTASGQTGGDAGIGPATSLNKGGDGGSAPLAGGGGYGAAGIGNITNRAGLAGLVPGGGGGGSVGVPATPATGGNGLVIFEYNYG